jgi:hypothetical protein
MVEGVVVFTKEILWIGNTHYLMASAVVMWADGCGVVVESEIALDGSKKEAQKDRRGREIISQAPA